MAFIVTMNSTYSSSGIQRKLKLAFVFSIAYDEVGFTFSVAARQAVNKHDEKAAVLNIIILSILNSITNLNYLK